MIYLHLWAMRNAGRNSKKILLGEVIEGEMKYLNQFEYKHILYKTRLKKDVEEWRRFTTIATSGCGLCSACMAVDALTDKAPTLEECVQLSYDCEANLFNGTDMSVFGPAIAEKFNLDYASTSDLDEAIEHLRKGGQIVVHVRRSEPGIALFTKAGHYMLITATDGREFCILDPSYTPEKFHIPEREGKVNDKNAPYLYCDVNVVHAEAHYEKPKYHLFSRRKK